MHPSLIALYAAWVVAFLLFPPDRRLEMSAIFGAATFGAWQLAAGLAGLTRHPLQEVSRGRVAIGSALLFTGFVRYNQWFIAELISYPLMLAAIFFLARSVRRPGDRESVNC